MPPSVAAVVLRRAIPAPNDGAIPCTILGHIHAPSHPAPYGYRKLFSTRLVHRVPLEHSYLRMTAQLFCPAVRRTVADSPTTAAASRSTHCGKSSRWSARNAGVGGQRLSPRHPYRQCPCHGRRGRVYRAAISGVSAHSVSRVSNACLKFYVSRRRRLSRSVTCRTQKVAE